MKPTRLETFARLPEIIHSHPWMAIAQIVIMNNGTPDSEAHNTTYFQIRCQIHTPL